MVKTKSKKTGQGRKRGPAQSGGKRSRQGNVTKDRAIPFEFLDIFNSANDGIVLLECQSWNIIDVNPSFENMLGYKSVDVSGKKLWEVPDQTNGELIKKALFEVFQKGSCHLNYLPIKTREDEVINFELTTTLLNGGKSKSMLCILRPSENAYSPLRGLSDDSILQSHNVLVEQFSAELLENANLIVIFINSDSEITLFNRKAETFTGKTWEDVRGKKFYNIFIAPKSREKIKFKFNQILSGEETVETYEYPIRNSFGAERLVLWRNSLVINETNDVIGLLAIGEDITDMKVLERRLKLYSDAIKSSIDSMIITDLNGYIIYNNRAAEKIYGYNTGELSGKNIHIFYPGGIDHNFIETFNVVSQQGFWQGEERQIRKDGTTTTIYQTMSQITDEQEKEIAILTVGRDISDAKRLEQDLQDAKNSSELYLDILTHDLNNLNQGILGQLELLKRSIKPKTGNGHHLDSALAQLSKGTRLIGSVKKLTKIEQSEKKLQKQDLKSIIEQCIKLVEIRYPSKKIRFRGNFKQLKYSIMVDEFVFELFTNLLDNAVKFDKHQQVEIGINVIEIRKNSRPYVKISILDSGCGIPDSEKSLIFKRFHRNSGSPNGSGLGLSIVKSLVDRYEGAIQVDDRVPADHRKGSVFNVLLPLKEEGR